MNIQWYPGHMAKAKRKILEDLKLVDIAIELLDARIPISSRNPEIDQIVGNKKRLIVLNKSDMADQSINKQWIEYFKDDNIKCIVTDSINGKGLKDVISAANILMKEKNDKLKEKGLLLRTTRALIIGIPNVGKSSFINKLAGKAIAKTGDKPGVTKAKQWIKVSNEFELLDTPGILWPKFEDKRVGINLALTGAIRDEILDLQELVTILLDFLISKYPEKLLQRYKLNVENMEWEIHDIIREIGRKRGCIISGGEIDLQRTSVMLLDEFRGSKIGQISLENPIDIVAKA